MTTPPHRQRRVHVHIMTGKIQTDQPLEDDAPTRERAGQEDKQAGCRAAVGHHVEDGAEAGGLMEVARRVAVERVEDAGDAVEEGAGAWVERHVVEGGDG